MGPCRRVVLASNRDTTGFDGFALGLKGNGALVGEGTPMSNLFLSLVDRMGAKAERIGDSNGKFEKIS